jgi:glucan phosphoethanolaminetransferase (alkaline phosphatase superfamily)
MEIQASQLILGATVIFIVGLIIFSVAFQSYGIMVDLRQSMGVNVSEAEVTTITSLLSLVPGVLTLSYFVFVGAVIWYVMKKSTERTQRVF